ncbi:MAG: nuclear transport factor 2 family protein [Bacteroidota bacterium]
MKISRIILFLFFISASMMTAKAQSEDEAVKLCVNNYLNGVLKGDAALLNQAFHPTAILRTVSAAGAIQDIPVAKFVASMPAGGIQTKGGSTKLVAYSYIGVSALATVELQFGDFKYIDLLSMLKFGNEWRIVSRVFSRADLDAQVKGMGMSSPTVATAPAKAAPKKSTANVKPKSDDGWK